MKRKECQASKRKQAEDRRRAMNRQSHRLCVLHKRWEGIQNVPLERVGTLNVLCSEAHFAEMTINKCGLIYFYYFSVVSASKKAQRFYMKLILVHFKGCVTSYVGTSSYCHSMCSLMCVVTCCAESATSGFVLYRCCVFAIIQIIWDTLKAHAHWIFIFISYMTANWPFSRCPVLS